MRAGGSSRVLPYALPFRFPLFFLRTSVTRTRTTCSSLCNALGREKLTQNRVGPRTTAHILTGFTCPPPAPRARRRIHPSSASPRTRTTCRSRRAPQSARARAWARSHMCTAPCRVGRSSPAPRRTSCGDRWGSSPAAFRHLLGGVRTGVEADWNPCVSLRCRLGDALGDRQVQLHAVVHVDQYRCRSRVHAERLL